MQLKEMKSIRALFPIQLGGKEKKSLSKDDKDTAIHDKGTGCAGESTGLAVLPASSRPCNK